MNSLGFSGLGEKEEEGEEEEKEVEKGRGSRREWGRVEERERERIGSLFEEKLQGLSHSGKRCWLKTLPMK